MGEMTETLARVKRARLVAMRAGRDIAAERDTRRTPTHLTDRHRLALFDVFLDALAAEGLAIVIDPDKAPADG